MLNLESWHQRYIHQARWTEQVRHYLFHQLEVNKNLRILEVGCGSGVITTDLHAYTPAKVYGLDLSLKYLEFAAQNDKSTGFTCGDALSLPYESGGFDNTLCHFVLIWLKDPSQALKEMRRVTRPGGMVAALAEPDYGGRIDYPAALAELGQMQGLALRQQGADPYLGRRLASLFIEAGLSGVQTGLLGGHWRQPPSPGALESEWSVLESDLSGRIDKQKLQSLRDLDAVAWQKGERILFVPTFYAWGMVSS